MVANIALPRPGPALLPLILLLLFAPGLGGCQHVIEPPRAVADPVQVYVIDYGRHASLALPAEGAGLVEWSWGDWNWFALERTGVLSGLRALFVPSQGTLSRRALVPVAGAGELEARLGAQEVLAFDVERARAAALLRDLEARWRRRLDEAVVHPNGRIFVPDERDYTVFDNSVHQLADWLRALGAEVSGTALTAHFELRRPAPP